MKAMVLNRYGADAPFELTEMPSPEVKPGHVRVRVSGDSARVDYVRAYLPQSRRMNGEVSYSYRLRESGFTHNR